MPFRPGENVGPYRIIEQLGQGGMATVFKAFHPALDRHVAIKALHPAFMEDPHFLARFEREARVVAKLDHPNIVPIYDFADHGGQPYLVMKFIPGETLKAVLDRRQLGGADVLKIVKAVGDALSYAHGKGYLHRDVKPSNILLADDGQIYLADFGLARIAEAGQSTLSGDQLLGTPHYISPEQARGERDLDEGTDIYSLGIVLYQLTVGRVPFSSDTPFSIIHDHIYTPLPVPHHINPSVSEDLETVLLKSLSKDRSDRYESVNDLVNAFERAFEAQAGWLPSATTQVALEVAPAPAAAAAESRAAPSAAVPAGSSVEPVPEHAPARPRRWAWVLGGLFLSVICLGTFLIATAAARGAPSEPIRDVDAGTAAEVDSPSEIAIQAARQNVSERPEDPYAHLELANAQQEAGFSNAASKEFTRAGELLLAEEAYPQAAEVLIQAMKLGEGRDSLLSSLLGQALFLGAPTGEMDAWIEAAHQVAPDHPGLAAIEARSMLFQGQRDEAGELLESILSEQPEDVMANAVMVDILALDGRLDEAIQLADRLLAQPRLPEWLAMHLKHFKEPVGRE